MRNERTANELLQDYAVKEWEQRQAWAKVLAAPVKPRPEKKRGHPEKIYLIQGKSGLRVEYREETVKQLETV